MTIQEVQAANAVLEKQISQLVQQFEASTGCVVHSIPVIAATASTPATARVKVQIP